MLPRQILPGSTYLVTRRCTKRQFLLKPSKRTNRVFLYCLAHACEVTGVQVHAVTVMSNHYHAVVTDPEGRLPKFAELLNKYVAKCQNAGYGLWEKLVFRYAVNLLNRRFRAGQREGRRRRRREHTG